MRPLTAEVIDVQAVRAEVEDPGFGAVLVFEGVARNHFDQRPVMALEYEAYDAMVQPVLEAIRAEVDERWPGTKIAVVHRTGRLEIGEASLVIAVGTAHRAACYAASRYAIEEIKERLPVWKKEHYADGESGWRANTPREEGA